MPEAQPEVIRDYTATKNVPVLVGRFRDGMRLPGGPYTLLQLAVFGVSFLLLVNLLPLLGFVPGLVQLPLSFGAAWAGAWAAGRLPRTSRSIPSLLVGVGSALLSPPAGTVAGRSVLPPRPRMAASTAKRAPAAARAVLFEAHAGEGLAPVATAPIHPEVPAAAELPPAFTGLDRLRALTRKDAD